MSRNELTAFRDFSGERVDLDFLGADSILRLSNQEELNLKEGAVLKAVNSGRRVQVGAELSSSGGQGIVYESDDPNYVIKLYRKESRTKYTEKKLKKMVDFNNSNPSICWPVDILKTYGDVFVGFLMPAVKGKNFYSLTTNPRRVIKNYPTYNRPTQVNMILETLHLFKYLHDINVLVGDVKLENVMFDSDFHVTLIDIDSAQVEQFPCVSSTPGYDAPEVILSRGRDKFEETINDTYTFNCYYRDFYRTRDIESFSISVLLYRLLMNGHFPYDYRDYGKSDNDEHKYNNNELCIDHRFAYGVEPTQNPDLCEPEIWSHLPSFLKEAFVDVFTYNHRYTVDEWIKFFERYRDLLASGELKGRDPECDSAFPDTVLDYNTVRFDLTKTVERSGFVMTHAVGRIVKLIGRKELFRHINTIVKALKQQPEFIIDSYKFRLIYNIGVLKKVSCEYAA